MAKLKESPEARKSVRNFLSSKDPHYQAAALNVLSEWRLPLVHPGFPPSALQSYQFNLDFRTYLALWTNATATSGASGDIASTSYGVVLEQPWAIQATYTVDASGAGTAVGAPSITAEAGTTHTPIVAASATGITIDIPTASDDLGFDASH